MRNNLVIAAICLLTAFGAYATELTTIGAPAIFPVPDADELGGDDRYLCLLATDKPAYRKNETVYLRAVFLDAAHFRPMPDDASLVYLTIAEEQGKKNLRVVGRVEGGVAGLRCFLPFDMPTGNYTATVRGANGAVGVRRFSILPDKPPRLGIDVTLSRDSYRPGDVVSATVAVHRPDEGVPPGAAIRAIATIDGEEAARVEARAIDADGTCRLTFRLPRVMKRGEGILTVSVDDNGFVDTATKAIPILADSLDIVFYPESGDLVAGLPGRLYVQANRPDGKPAAVRGEIIRVDGDGRPDDKGSVGVETAHEGRGAAVFTPRAGERYALRLLDPPGIDRFFPLPETKASGAVIRSAKGVYEHSEAVTLMIRATSDSDAAVVTLFRGERRVAERAIAPGETCVVLDPGDTEGVLTATVWDKHGRPLAERLVFRKPRSRVRVAVRVLPEAGSSLVPGGQAKITVRTTDETGKPIGATVGLTITDDNVAKMLEARDLPPRLSAMAYLESETLELADARAYFDPDNEHADRDIDLLLCTQGWRRFILVRLEEALERWPAATRRALAMATPVPPEDIPTAPPAAWPRVRDWPEPAAAWIDKGPATLHTCGCPRFRPSHELPPGKRIIQYRKLVEPGQMVWRLQDSFGPYVAAVEFAGPVRSQDEPCRAHTAATAYWHAGIATNPADGAGSASFTLPDSITAFTVQADAFTAGGALGEGTAAFATIRPFALETVVPATVMAGDRLAIPAILTNGEERGQADVRMEAWLDGAAAEIPQLPSSLSPRSSERVLIGYHAEKPGMRRLRFFADAGGWTAWSERDLAVLPDRFDVVETVAGAIGAAAPFTATVTVPKESGPTRIRATAKVFPALPAILEDAHAGMARRPHANLEQAVSTLYPLMAAQRQYLLFPDTPVDRVPKTSLLLGDGYRRLAAFENPSGGYGWFPGDPADETVTAYALMQLAELRHVMTIDEDGRARTRKWLLSRRDGAGGFRRAADARGSLANTGKQAADLYIVWALLESGEDPGTLSAEIAAAEKTLAETDDPYLISLGANILRFAGGDGAEAACVRLASLQKEDGSVPGGAISAIHPGGGESLLAETTALAALAWIRCGDAFTPQAEAAVSWLHRSRRSGTFASTQATALALKAFVAHADRRPPRRSAGSVLLVVDDIPISPPAAIDPRNGLAVKLPDFNHTLSSGVHSIRMVMSGAWTMQAALEVSGIMDRPPVPPEPRLALIADFAPGEAVQGERVVLSVSVRAVDGAVFMPVAVIGIPAGLELPAGTLERLKAEGKIAAYEMLDLGVALYWHALPPGGKTELSIPFTAKYPGTFTIPPSQAFAGYEDAACWSEGGSLTIMPR